MFWCSAYEKQKHHNCHWFFWNSPLQPTKTEETAARKSVFNKAPRTKILNVPFKKRTREDIHSSKNLKEKMKAFLLSPVSMSMQDVFSKKWNYPSQISQLLVLNLEKIISNSLLFFILANSSNVCQTKPNSVRYRKRKVIGRPILLQLWNKGFHCSIVLWQTYGGRWRHKQWLTSNS